MARTRQSGYLYRKGSKWCLRYYDVAQDPDGTIRHPQRSKVLVEAEGPYRSKKAVQLLAEEFLRPLNIGTVTPSSGMSLKRFVEDLYLPFAERQKRPSTYDGYRKMWKVHLEPRAGRPLRDYRTVDLEQMLNNIRAKNDLTTTTLRHVKHLLSGVFRYAIRCGILNPPNPVREVCAPEGRSSEDTYAYSLDGIVRMLGVLPEPARTLSAVAAFTGLRRGELRGLKPDDYDGQLLIVRRSIWRKHVGAPKGKRGTGAVPVIAPLARMIEQYLLQYGPKTYLFESMSGGPVSVEYIAREVIRPTLRKVGMEWHGWHAFRRGLATNLHVLGVSDIVIQAILRHSDVAVTRQSYIKHTGVDERSVAAMKALESLICTKHAPGTGIQEILVVVQ